MRRALRAAAAAALLLAVAGAGAVPPAAAGESSARKASRASERRLNKVRRVPGRPQPRLTPAPTPRVGVLVNPPQAPVGTQVTVTVRLEAGNGAARHVSLHLGADPQKMRYVGYQPHGRGALLVEPSPTNEGEIVIYRSSLPEGFPQVETIVDLEFEVIAPGECVIVPTDVRLMDGLARELTATQDATTIWIE